jgi:hypothetical protein
MRTYADVLVLKLQVWMLDVLNFLQVSNQVLVLGTDLVVRTVPFLQCQVCTYIQYQSNKRHTRIRIHDTCNKMTNLLTSLLFV